MMRRAMDGMSKTKEFVGRGATCPGVGQAAQNTDEGFVTEGGVEVDGKLIDEWEEPWEKGEVLDEVASLVGGPGGSRA